MIAGRTIGKYRIVEQIGRGGMGTVYKAVDETLDRVVAIKMINAELMSPERMQRFRSEAVALARLNHPRIATIHELTREGDDLVMVMEYVAGETCERLLARNGALSVEQAVVLCDQVLDALQHAHSAGIVHRDLKPANLMVTPPGDLKVMDFGIARIAGSEHLTSDGFMMGTPAYMSPEQVRGAEVDHRMDLYAVAVILYRLVTNHLPFRADNPIAIMHSHLMEQPTPPRQLRPDLPPWIEEILERGLAKAADDRVQTALEFRESLDRGLNGTLATRTRPWVDRTNAETIFGPAIPETSIGRTSAETYVALTPTGPAPTPSRAIPAASRPFPIPSATPPAAPTPTPAPTTAQTHPTVTLQRQHLAVAAALLGLLVVGVAFLGYAALRRTAGTSIASTEGTAAPAPASAPDPSLAPAATPQVPGTATPPAPASAVPAQVPAAQPPTGRGAAAADTSRGADGKAKAAPPPPLAAVVPAAKEAVSSPPPAAAPTVAAPTVAATPVAPSPPVASVATESFGDVRAVLPPLAPGGKSRDLDALLSLEPGRLVVRSRDSGAVVKSWPYNGISAATYTQARRPRGSSTTAVAPLPENVAGSGFFGTAKHWLTLQSDSDFLVLRLEDRNVLPIMMALESRTGVKTERPDQAR